MIKNALRNVGLLAAVVVALVFVFLLAAAGCSPEQRQGAGDALHNASTKPVGEIVSKGVTTTATVGADVATGNYQGAAKSVLDYFAWLFAGGATVTTVGLGRQVRKLTRPYDRNRDGERRNRRAPSTSPPPAPPAPPGAPASSSTTTPAPAPTWESSTVIPFDRRQAA